MKLKNISKLNLSSQCLNDLYFDHSSAIVHDEFCRKDKNSKLDYRNRGINRLIKENLSFKNDCNVTWDMVQRFIKVFCPYCEKEMKYNGGGGSGSNTCSDFVCDCGSKAYMSFGPGDLSFEPKESIDSQE